jgi:hypothetical protein
MGTSLGRIIDARTSEEQVDQVPDADHVAAADVVGLARGRSAHDVHIGLDRIAHIHQVAQRIEITQAQYRGQGLAFDEGDLPGNA